MKKSRHHSWLVTLPLVGIVVAYMWFVVLPGKRAIAQLNAELADKQAFIAGAGHLAVSRSEVERQLAAAETYCHKWQTASGDSSHLAAMYGEIAELLKTSGVTTTRFAPEADEKLDLLQKTPVQIACTGSFAQISQLLAGLEALPQRMWIEDVSLQAIAAKDKNGKVMQCELTLAIFAGNSEKTD